MLEGLIEKYIPAMLRMVATQVSPYPEYLFLYLSIYLSIYLYLYLSIYLSTPRPTRHTVNLKIPHPETVHETQKLKEVKLMMFLTDGIYFVVGAAGSVVKGVG